MTGYGPNNGVCGRSCGCPELCPAGESKAEQMADWAAEERATKEAMDDRADRAVGW